MNKETLRMQMLAGVITESQYKEKLNERYVESVADHVNSNKDEFLEKMAHKGELYGIDYSSFFPFEQTSNYTATSTGGDGVIHAAYTTGDLFNSHPEDEGMDVKLGGKNIVFGTPDGLW